MAKRRHKKPSGGPQSGAPASDSSNLDPHLRHVLRASDSGLPVDPSVLSESETGETEVEVLAKLSDPSQDVPGLHVVKVLGQLVTGSVAVSSIEAVHNHPNVISLKRATRLEPDLAFSVAEIRATPAQLQAVVPPGTDIDGAGVVVGVVDYGCDFLHDNFRRADGTTRLLCLWDQRGELTSSSPVDYPYGREYDAAAINQAIAQASAPPPATDPIYQQYKFPEDPNNLAYTALGYAPDPTPIDDQVIGEHGTHVMDIAAGNGRGSGHPGVAPGADLIFVQVAANDYQANQSFGNSRRLVEAVNYVFDRAAALGRRCVVNISLGTHGGPHDGSTLVEQWFDGFLTTPGRAIVISAGNSFTRRSHASGQVTSAAPRTLTWNTGLPTASGTLVDLTGNELEVWYPGDRALSVSLVSPAGQTYGPVALGAAPLPIMVGGVERGLIIHLKHDPDNGDNQIDILLSAQLPLGAWKVELSTPGPDPVPFHAWIERDDRGQSRFAAADADATHTIGSISCGASTIAVGSYDARHPSRGLSTFSSAGPTRDGKQKPEVSAPGQDVEAAWSLTRDRATAKSGTSMAAPHVTGLVALLLQAASDTPTIAHIRDAVAAAARTGPPPAGGWHPRYGVGRVDAAATVAAQFDSSPLEQSPSVGPARATTAPTNGRPVANVEDVIRALADAGRKANARLKIEIVPD